MDYIVYTHSYTHHLYSTHAHTHTCNRREELFRLSGFYYAYCRTGVRPIYTAYIIIVRTYCVVKVHISTVFLFHAIPACSRWGFFFYVLTFLIIFLYTRLLARRGDAISKRTLHFLRLSRLHIRENTRRRRARRRGTDDNVKPH